MVYKRTFNSAIRTAGAASAAYKTYRNAKKPRRSTRKPLIRKARRYAKSKTTTYRRRRVVKQNHAIENKTITMVNRARAPSALYLARAMMEPSWWRVQGLTQFDTATGFLPIANRTETNAGSTGVRVMPMHVWDLSSIPNIKAGALTDAPAGYGVFLANANAGATVSMGELNSQDANGAQRNFNSKWISENRSTNQAWAALPKRKCIHDYTHVKLNLYGVRKRATRFVVQLVMVKDEFADFLTGAGTNIQKQKLIDYMVRPFVFSNLNSGDPQSKHLLKVLKTYDVTIGPTDTTEYGGTTATPHIQTVDWFIRHNRLRRYDWLRDAPPANNATANFDLEDLGHCEIRVEPTKRVYLVIRALSPEIRNVDLNWNTLPDPISEPSYDYVIRNKFSHPE